MKIFLNILFISLMAQFAFVIDATAQEVEKSECMVRESGQESCSGTTENPMRRHEKDNSGITPQAGAAFPLVTAPGSGNSNNGCALCAPPNVDDPQDIWDRVVPGATTGGTGTAVEFGR